MNQTFETINWEIEAIRVATAFGVKEKCEFLEDDNAGRALRGLWCEREVSIAQELFLNASYDEDGRKFLVGTPDTFSYVHIFWDNRKPVINVDWYEKEIFVSALLCLNLLTPDIENELGITLSAHQKMEEVARFEEQYREYNGVRNGHTASEIKKAFGLENNVEFKNSSQDISILESFLPDGTRLRIEEFEHVHWFTLEKESKGTTIGVDWYGHVIQEPTQLDYAKQMAQALKFLYRFNDEISRALKVEEADGL